MAANDTTKRFLLILLAVGLLVIFSVTGAMSMFFGEMFSGDGSEPVATFQLDGELREVTLDEFQTARFYSQLEGRMGLTPAQRPSQEEWVVHQIFTEIADEHGIAVSTAELVGFLAPALQAPGGYEGVWRSMGFNSVTGFENAIRHLLRLRRVRDALAAGAEPTTKEVLEWWSKQYQEMRLQYLTFEADEYAEAAAAEEPDEEALNAFYQDNLTTAQKRELEAEENVSFEILLISLNDFDVGRLDEWFTYEEPGEDTLRGFYDVHRFDLYLRDVPAGQVPDPTLEPLLAWEEVQDRIGTDYKLMEAARQLLARTADIGEKPLHEWAGEMGVGFFRYPKQLRSKLKDLELIGGPELDRLFTTPVNTFMSEPVYNHPGDAIFIARANEIVDRQAQTLEQTRDRVLGYWRENRALELAREAAQAFVDGLPEPQDYVEGDPVGLPADVFEQLASESGRELQELDWISGFPRPTVDPKWEPGEKVLPWFRAMVARDLENMIDEQIIGPLEHPSIRMLIVGRLDGRRDADPLSIWPAELDAARQGARYEFGRQFVEENLGFEGMQIAYDIQWVQREQEEEDLQ